MTKSGERGDGRWPALPLEAWLDTKRTLHRYCQIVGKVRMALVPFRNHWWHVTLYPHTRGLSTGLMPAGDGRALEIAFDLIDHRLVVASSDGRVESFPLVEGLACMDFYRGVFGLLDRFRVPVRISSAPYDIGGPLLSQDREHCTYDADAVQRYWVVLRGVADALGEFAGWFNGKQSPVHLFWHSFDLAMARYSGRPAPPRPGRVATEAYSHEVIAFGFWPGDDKVPYPALYSYTAPAPPGLVAQPLRPPEARWNVETGTALLPYDVVRTSPNPRATLLEFFTSAYQAGARTAGWDLPAFTTSAAPPPSPS